MQEKKKDLHNQSQTIKKMAIGTYILIITLNVNGLNTPTKRHTMAEWIQKQDPYICCLQEIHFRPKHTYRLKVKNLQPRLLYLARISLKIDGEIKSFSHKQKLKEFSTTKPALQQILKGLIQSRNTREEISTKSTPNN